MARLRLVCFSLAHFLVDLCCALLLLGRVCGELDAATGLLLYNFFAFAVQMPMGLVADRAGHGELFAAAGCALVAVGWVLPPGLAAAVIAGLGNAAFHVGGGLDVMNSGPDRAGPLGVFVSPGAFGVYFGTALAGSFHPLPVVAVLTAAGVGLALLGKGAANAPAELPRPAPGLLLAALCLTAVVALRSYLGCGAAMPWKPEYPLLAVCAVALGKAAGGILSDRLGLLPVSVVSLSLASALFLFADSAPAGLAALLLFNMTMPLTLHAMAKIFPGAKGFSFGALTFALFLGFLPSFFGAGGLTTPRLALVSAVSLAVLLPGLAFAGGGRRDAD